jgi:hypothetical protein
MDLNKLTFVSRSVQGRSSSRISSKCGGCLHLLCPHGQQDSIVPAMINKFEIDREKLKQKNIR